MEDILAAAAQDGIRDARSGCNGKMRAAKVSDSGLAAANTKSTVVAVAMGWDANGRHEPAIHTHAPPPPRSANAV